MDNHIRCPPRLDDFCHLCGVADYLSGGDAGKICQTGHRCGTGEGEAKEGAHWVDKNAEDQKVEMVGWGLLQQVVFAV